MKTGVYTITNIVDNKIYVGYSNNIQRRFYEHKTILRANTHPNLYLQKSWNKYKEDSFVFEVLVECEQDFLLSEENYWCNILNTHDRKYGYNINLTSSIGSCKLSYETRRKISIKSKGENNGFYGKKHSEKTKKLIMARNKGTKMSNDFKEKRRQYMKSIDWKPSLSMQEKMVEKHGRRIVQISLNGEFLKEFYTIRKAMDAVQLNSSSGHIVNCCKSNRLSCKGYSWMYKEEWEDPIKKVERIKLLREKYKQNK